jgi:hypothetical protein
MFDTAVEQLAAATGRRIRHVRVSTGRCAALLADHDVPDEVVVRLTRVLATLVDSDVAGPRDIADRARLEPSARVPQAHPAGPRSHHE